MKTDYKIAYSMGQFATSLNLCVETLRADPDKFDALVFAGLNCIALNQAKQAEGYFRRGLNLSVKNGELNFCLVMLSSDSREFPRHFNTMQKRNVMAVAMSQKRNFFI